MTPAPPTAAFSALGPDFPFAYDDWLAHPAGLGEVPPEALGQEVAVIGAGVAGVVAAYELLKMGLHPVIYEAGRIGGRLRSQSFNTADGVIAELGGMRFPATGRAFWHYVDEVGLQTAPFPNPLTPAAGTTVIDLAGESHFAQTLADLPALFHEVATAWDQALEDIAEHSAMRDAMRRGDAEAIQAIWHRLVPAWDDRSFYDFLATAPPFERLSFRHREVFGQVGFGTGGWDSDFSNTMLEILRVVMCGFDDDQHLIVGGAEQLVRRLWARAPAEPVHWSPGTSLASLHNGAPKPAVARLDRTPGSEAAGAPMIRVTDRNGVVHDYPAVLSTVQSWLLTTGISVDESLFSPPVWMALDRTTYAQSSKTFVMVDRPFWNDISPTTGRPVMAMTLTDRNTRGTYLFDNGPGRPAVICLSYAWMSDSMKVLPLDAAERARLAIETLTKIYPEAEIASHVIGEPLTVSWEADPNFQGAFKGSMPGHYRYSRRMFAHFMQDGFPPPERGIFLAGDDVSWTPGWVEGAVQTALNAVWGIAHHFGGNTPPENPGPGDLWPQLQPLRLPH